MKKLAQKILLGISVITVLMHGIIPHFHYEVKHQITHHHSHHEHEKESNHHDHQENKDNHHSLFSFAQLDESFIPSKWQYLSVELPLLYLVTPVITYQYNPIKEKSKTYFGFYKEFPPPGNFLSTLPSRGPPCNSIMA